MCGLAGFFDPSGIAVERATALVQGMSRCVAHRGPNDSGVWVDGDAGIALGHQRLSILDLSQAGHQPMRSPGGRYVIVLNGEIYNHEELRAWVGSGQKWRGHSDTEALLAAFDRYGIEATLRKAVGMFAFAVWDNHERSVILARDRLGEKPLYYGWQHGVLLFGSELKSLRSHPAFAGEIDRRVVSLYLRNGYVPAPYSIYLGILKLMPGTFLRLSARDTNLLAAPTPYWSMRGAVEAGLHAPFDGTPAEAVEELEQLLKTSVRLQSVADVPLGAFLSGGVDSSSIVALMQAQSTRPIRTFTIGFSEERYNEATYARAVAQHLGTDHTELYVTARDALEVVPRLPTMFDEPFGDASAIPTFLVARMARQHVTVSLSGDGGDELFGGYSRYARNERIWSAIRRIPAPGRRLLGAGLIGAARAAGQFLPSWAAARDKARAVSLMLATPSMKDFYELQVSQWKEPESLIVDSAIPSEDTESGNGLANGRLHDWMMYSDTVSYLPDDILVKVDRAAMAVGLESRVPLLDHRIVEFAWRLPLDIKVRDGKGKWPLRRIVSKYVPDSLIERPKAGFGAPVDEWVRGPLRDWAEDLLSEQSLAAGGIFRPAEIRRQWRDHLSGANHQKDPLWAILQFQAWLKTVTPHSR